MMSVACPRCGELATRDARFCITCGATLQPVSGASPRAGATGPTLRLGQAHPRGRAAIGPRDGIPLIGLLFGALFLVAIAQLMANGWLRSHGGPPLQPALVGLLLGGALLAERAWVNGQVLIG